MKQSEYLRELKENLEGKLPQETLKDILSDYECFFLSGREDGKTDDEIANELGSPAFLAKSLLAEHAETEQALPDIRIANPSHRLSAFFIDAIIAVLPAFVVTCVLGSAVLSYVLLLMYPSPLAGASVLTGHSTYQELVATETTSDGSGAISGEGQEIIQSDSRKPTKASIALALISLAFYLLYSLGATLFFRGQTIGKKLMGIKVRRSDAAPLTKGSIFNRELLGKVVINSIPIVPVISIFTILFTKERKALHDMLAGTIVSNS